MLDLSPFSKVFEGLQKVLVTSREVWCVGSSQLSEAEPGEHVRGVLGGRCCRAENSEGLLALPAANAPECSQGQG